MEGANLKINYIGIVAAILAFISLALPWWIMSMSMSSELLNLNADVSVYLYQATASALGVSTTVSMNLWFSWAALAMMAIAGIAGLAGSVMVGKTGKMLLVVAGIVALLSIIIFAVGLQGELANAPPVAGFPSVGLFSSGSVSFMSYSMNLSSYLTYGFWLALVAAILALVSILKHPMAAEAAAAAAPAQTTET